MFYSGKKQRGIGGGEAGEWALLVSAAFWVVTESRVGDWRAVCHDSHTRNTDKKRHTPINTKNRRINTHSRSCCLVKCAYQPLAACSHTVHVSLNHLSCRLWHQCNVTLIYTLTVQTISYYPKPQWDTMCQLSALIIHILSLCNMGVTVYYGAILCDTKMWWNASIYCYRWTITYRLYLPMCTTCFGLYTVYLRGGAVKLQY